MACLLIYWSRNSLDTHYIYISYRHHVCVLICVDINAIISSDVFLIVDLQKGSKESSLQTWLRSTMSTDFCWWGVLVILPHLMSSSIHHPLLASAPVPLWTPSAWHEETMVNHICMKVWRHLCMYFVVVCILKPK